MRIVAIADTHGKHRKVSLLDGDVLIHAGDFTHQGEPEEVRAFVDWLSKQSYEQRIVVAGNHEICLDPDDPHFDARDHAIETIESEAVYLENESVTVDGTTIFGSPNTPNFNQWAFERDENELDRIYESIPDDTDILVTHGPPRGILDEASRTRHLPGGWDGGAGRTTKRVGSTALRDAVKRVNPDVHLFGHIHEGYGDVEKNGTRFINCSVLDGDYNPTNDPVVIEL